VNVDDKHSENSTTTAILMDAGIELMRQNIRRTHSGMPREQVEAILSAWLWRTDDPIPGDVAGAVRVRETSP